jgi:hypothetical protein
MTKTPAKQGPGSPSRLPALDEGIARLRQVMGKPERRVISGACSIHGNGFSIVYERTDPRSRFKLSAVEKLTADDPADESAGPVAKARAQPAEAFNSQDFDNAGFACPWCGSPAGRVYHHNCSTTYCGGARTADSDGAERFTCPSCKERFELVTAEVIHGNSAGAERAGPGDNKLIEQAKRMLFPKWHR